MSTSKQLITALEKSDWLDRMLLMAGLLFFFLVVAFILKQRILDRGLRIAFWWTRFLPSTSTSPTVIKKAADVALKKAEEGSAAAATVISTLTTAATAAASSALSASSAGSASVVPEFSSLTPVADTIVGDASPSGDPMSIPVASDVDAGHDEL